MHLLLHCSPPLHLYARLPPPHATFVTLGEGHASFPDFLLDESRSGEFYIDLSHIHDQLAFASLGIMKDGLRFNICEPT